ARAPRPATWPRHAPAARDSTADQASPALVSGTQAAEGFTPQTFAIHNRGYSTFQAKLLVNAMTFNGGDGHFSFVSQPDTQTVEDVGLRYSVGFDPTGATPDSQYTATWTIETSDENLPGAAPQATLTLSLPATVSPRPPP